MKRGWERVRGKSVLVGWRKGVRTTSSSNMTNASKDSLFVLLCHKLCLNLCNSSQQSGLHY